MRQAQKEEGRSMLRGYKEKETQIGRVRRCQALKEKPQA
jgi:hypothetical protein